MNMTSHVHSPLPASTLQCQGITNIDNNIIELTLIFQYFNSYIMMVMEAGL